jgi:hypothetical protein
VYIVDIYLDEDKATLLKGQTKNSDKEGGLGEILED